MKKHGKSRGGFQTRPYSIHYHPDVVEKDIPQLPPTVKTRIRKAIEERLTVAPEQYGRPMRYTLKGLWRLRIGNYRVVYVIHESEVWILKIGHRKDVYEGLEPRK